MQGNLHNTITDFSAETLQAKREGDDIFKMLKESNCQPRIFYPKKLCFRNDDIKTLPNKQKNSSSLNLREIL